MSDENATPSRPLPLIRRSTSNILENLLAGSQRSTTNSRWYEPGRDFCFYTAAHGACRDSRARLSKLELTGDEKMLLAAPRDIAGLQMKLMAIQTEQERSASERSSSGKKASDFMNNFCDFATRTSGIVEILLPQSPEYTITYGILLILFKSVVTKKEREESLTEYLLSLTTQLPMIEFYRTAFPTDAMKLAVAGLFAEIMTLLDEALVYYRSGRLSKLTNAILSPSDNKFDGYVKRVEAKVKKMLELKDVAHEAQTADMKDVVEGTGQGMLFTDVNLKVLCTE